MTKNAYLGGKMEELPRRDGSYYVVKSMPDNKLLHYDSAGMDKYFYEEQPGEWNWEIGGAVKGILGYECIEATTEFHGRKWTAWFAPEVPVQNGPWKLGGLPGLILEACPEGGNIGLLPPESSSRPSRSARFILRMNMKRPTVWIS